MSSVRRRVLRPVPSEPLTASLTAARLTRIRARLAKERGSLKRWLTKLKRATNTVTALFQSISRLEVKLGN